MAKINQARMNKNNEASGWVGEGRAGVSKIHSQYLSLFELKQEFYPGVRKIPNVEDSGGWGRSVEKARIFSKKSPKQNISKHLSTVTAVLSLINSSFFFISGFHLLK